MSNFATYSPEDNKLRLYVGRVPRAEYEALRAEGWTSTPKQDCDFVATWTPSRKATAESYCDDGQIEDEDQGPADRAADRAERFSGYLEKRLDEATGHADRYDAGPIAHGYQSKSRAARAADRHDRSGTRAVDAWSKAEYWQRRTAGVISHALHLSKPSVRMGRIKELETELRRFERSPSHYPNWIAHTKLRLAYENQMLEAVGGRATLVEMEPGGWLGKHQIHKVNKSNASGNVVSVELRFMSDTNRYGRVWDDGKGSRMMRELYNVERLKASVYRAPTPEEKAAFLEAQKAAKKERAATAPKAPPLINPTLEDAQRLQDVINARAKAVHDARPGAKYARAFEPKQVQSITQAVYSANSGGSYARAETRGLCHDAELADEFSDMYSKSRADRAKRIGAPVCKVRVTGYDPVSIIHITDKPAKPFPAEMWEPIPAPAPEEIFSLV